MTVCFILIYRAVLNGVENICISWPHLIKDLVHVSISDALISQTKSFYDRKCTATAQCQQMEKKVKLYALRHDMHSVKRPVVSSFRKNSYKLIFSSSVYCPRVYYCKSIDQTLCTSK